jgi:UDP-N-acetylglucosamine 3-dehydrogenase
MDSVRVAIVGLGIFGETHVATLKTLPQVDVVAVCDLREDRAAAMAAQYDIPRHFTDCTDLLNAVPVDVVAVVTPEDNHLGPSLAAMEAGKAVFIEKPIASTLADADHIVEAAKRSGSVVMVGHILRFDPRYTWGKEWIEAGKVGRIASYYGRHNVIRSNIPIYQRVPLHLVSSIHHYDLARWYFGDEPETIYCVQHRALRGPVPDTCWIVAQFRQGGVATFETAWLIPERAATWLDTRVEVIGTEGTFEIDSRYQGVTAWSEQGTLYPRPGIVRGQVHASLRTEWEYFLACLAKGRQPEVITLEDACQALRIGLKAEESARTGQAVKF